MKKRTLIIGGIAAVVIIAAIVIGTRGSGTPTEQADTENKSLVNVTPLATATDTSMVQPTAIVAVNGDSCGTNCMWSSACVSGQYTYPEVDGMTRVQPNSCIPLDFSMWFIRPDNPFAGMPCAANDHVCMWSRACVTDYGVPAEKNGLARVVRNSCQIVP